MVHPYAPNILAIISVLRPTFQIFRSATSISSRASYPASGCGPHGERKRRAPHPFTSRSDRERRRANEGVRPDRRPAATSPFHNSRSRVGDSPSAACGDALAPNAMNGSTGSGKGQMTVFNTARTPSQWTSTRRHRLRQEELGHYIKTQRYRLAVLEVFRSPYFADVPCPMDFRTPPAMLPAQLKSEATIENPKEQPNHAGLIGSAAFIVLFDAPRAYQCRRQRCGRPRRVGGHVVRKLQIADPISRHDFRLSLGILR